MMRVWKKRLTAMLLTLTMLGSLMPAAFAEGEGDEPPVCEHQYDDSVWVKDMGSHWHECTECGAAGEKEAHDFVEDDQQSTTPTCFQPGKTVRVCTVCGYKQEITSEATGDHEYDETRWSSDNTYHWHACKTNGCTSVSGKEAHTPSDDGTVTDPTCTSDGFITYTCADCGKEYTRAGTKALGHVFVNNVCTRCNAKDTSTVTVTFKNGSSTFKTQTVTKGSKPASPGTPTYPSTGSYTFKGWVKTAPASNCVWNGTTTVLTSAQVASTAVSSNTTYYAVYVVNSDSVVTYTAEAGSKTAFKTSDFNKAYQKLSGTTKTISWVEFTVSTSDYNSFEGKIYSGDTELTRTKVNGSKFYYSNADYGDFALSRLYLVAPEDAVDDTLSISFTAYYSNSRYEEGTLKLVVKGEKSSDTVTYQVAPGKSVDFDEDDFKEVYQEEYSGNFRWVQFTAPSAISSAGTVYYKYGASGQKTISRTNLNGKKFYYGSNDDYGDYALDDLTFAAASDFSGEVKVTFRAYYSTSKYVDGTMILRSTKKSNDAYQITYEVEPGKSVDFDEDDFKEVYQEDHTGSIRWVQFTAPSAMTNAGTVYFDYDGKAEKSFSRSALNSCKFYYGSDDDYGDYALDDLTFVASSGFAAEVKVPFRVCYSATKYVDGTLVLKPKTSLVSNYVGNIRYTTTAGAKVQINANDIARFFKKNYPNSKLETVKLANVPATGSLYYNYYNASKYGSAASKLLTSDNCGSQLFYKNPTSASQYALSELTYVPSGSNYCTTILFSATGGGNTVAGSILICVSNTAVSEIYALTPKNTAVNFPAASVYSAVLGATGTKLHSIQLLTLPAASAGKIYVGSGTSTAANTTTRYPYGGTMDQLRFVPVSGYSGSVEIPYVAMNDKGVALASGVVSLGVVNNVKKFKDVTSSAWCYKYVEELSDSSVISGYTDGSFKPDNTVTYGAALKLIMLAAGYPEQKPTGKNVFSGYLDKARAEGIVTRGNVDLTKPITRQQVAQLAAGAMKLDTKNLSTVKPFTDTDDASIQALNAAGIVEGYFANGTSTFKPANTLTRGQVSAIVWRMRNYGK